MMGLEEEKQLISFFVLIPNIPSFQDSIDPSSHYSNIPVGLKRALEWLKILFSERNGFETTNPISVDSLAAYALSPLAKVLA
jgi:hypothetical protein